MKKRFLAATAWFVLMFLAVTPSTPVYASADCQPANRTAINFSSSGDNTVIAADSTSVLYVWQFFFVNGDASTATNITLKEGSTSISGAYKIAAAGSHTAACTGTPWAIVPAGSAFIMNSSAAVQVSGTVYYTRSR